MPKEPSESEKTIASVHLPCSLGALEAIHLKVVEASPDAKIVIDERGKVVVFNQAAEMLFGYDRSEVIGQEIDILLPERVKLVHGSHLKRYFQEPKTREMGVGMELFGRRRDGSEFPVQIKLAPIIVPQAGIHALAVVRRVASPTEPEAKMGTVAGRMPGQPTGTTK